MKKNNRGFTMAELLIVVAIIAVLVAVAIPTFTTQLEKSRQGTDVANLRSSYAEAKTEYLANNNTGTGTGSTYTVQHKDSTWKIQPSIDSDLQTAYNALASKSGSFYVTYSGSGAVLN